MSRFENSNFNQIGILSVFVSILSYGASVSATDNTTAIQSAIDATPVNGTTLIPSGTFITGTITINKTITLHLMKGATLKLKNATNDKLLNITSDGVVITGQGLLDGNKANQTSNCNVVNINNSYCTVQGLEVQNAKQYGIYVIGGSYNKILNNYVHDSGNIGIFIEKNISTSTGANYNLVQGNTVKYTDAEGGIKVHGDGSSIYCYGNRIIGNHIENPNQICIEVFGLSNRSVVEGNVCIGGQMGISVDTSDFSTITGNTIYNPSLYGVELASSKHCSVSGNTIDCNNNATEGIALTNTTPQYNTITGNSIYKAKQYGIHLNTGSDFTNISGNTIDIYVTYGMNIAGSSNVTISSNGIFNGGLKGIMLDNSNYVNIIGNQFKTATESGVLLSQSGAGTTDNILMNSNRFVSCNVYIGTQGTVGTNLTIKGNFPKGKDNVQSGTATIAASGTRVTVTYYPLAIPTIITPSAKANIGSIWIENITFSAGTATFDIVCSSAPASNTVVAWRAEY